MQGTSGKFQMVTRLENPLPDVQPHGRSEMLQLPFVESLLVKYGVGSFVVGCTEIQLLANRPRATALPADRV